MSTTGTGTAPAPPFPPILAFCASVLFASTSAVLIRLAEAPPVAVAFWRLFLSGTLLLAATGLLGLRRGIRILPPPREIPGVALAGVFLAGHFGFWIASLSFTSVASSALLLTIQLPAAALVSHGMLRERITRPLAASLVVTLAGAILLGWRDMHLSREDLFGDVLSAIGALFYVAYLTVGRRVRPRVPILPYLAALYGVGALAILPLALVGRVPITGFPAHTWWFLALLVLLPTIGGHGLLNYAVRYLRLFLASLTPVAEPILATLLAWVILREPPPSGTAWGGPLLLLGAVLAIRDEAKRGAPSAAPSAGA